MGRQASSTDKQLACSEHVTDVEPESFWGKILWTFWGKLLPEITNSEGEIGLGLTGAYCVRTSTERNTGWRGEESNSFPGTSLNTASQRCQNFWASGFQSGVPRRAATSPLGTLLEMQIFSYPRLTEWETLGLGSNHIFSQPSNWVWCTRHLKTTALDQSTEFLVSWVNKFFFCIDSNYNKKHKTKIVLSYFHKN